MRTNIDKFSLVLSRSVDMACAVEVYVEVHHPKFASALWELCPPREHLLASPFALSLNCIGVAVIMVSPMHQENHTQIGTSIQ